ncbi:hypothetical protein OEZ86_001666 [Tetradesmus obliquus]|nr:hypothetical protein OEZ86_001666 [Tetradesmus obliquus]
MASTRLGRAHTAAQARARSPSPPPRSLSGTLRSGPSFHGTSSSSSSHSSCAPVASPRSSRGRRSHTPPPARAVAVPLQDQLAADAEFRPDLVKVHMKCQYTTAFGQQLKVVGGAPELGEWDLARAPAMTWNEGHSWTLTAFLPPGTYPFKLVVTGPGGPESARWESGSNRSITIAAESPELGTAALVLVDCDFDRTVDTRSQTKRVTGIGFRSSSTKGNPHQSQGVNGSSAGGDGASLPSAAAFRTSKVTANAAFAAANRPVGLGSGTAPIEAKKVVSSFIKDHLKAVEGQALAMIAQNQRLERRMMALEQHVQSYDDTMMGALADNLQSAASAAAASASAAAAQASSAAVQQQQQPAGPDASELEEQQQQLQQQEEHLMLQQQQDEDQQQQHEAHLLQQQQEEQQQQHAAYLEQQQQEREALLREREALLQQQRELQQQRDAYLWQQQQEAGADQPAAAEQPRVSRSSRAKQNADPQWMSAHARAMQWASSLEEEEDSSSESEPDEDEVPWWLQDALPAVRPSPRPIGSTASNAPVGASGDAPYAHLKWSRSRVMSPNFAATAAALAERRQRHLEHGSWDEEDEDGSSSSRSSSQPPKPAFNGAGVTLAIATPATAAAAAAAAGASPLVYNMQQHAYKAAKATGQSDQAAAIAATAAAARVAYGYPQPAAALTGRRKSSKKQQDAAAAPPPRAGADPVAAVSAAVKARQQVLAVADVAVHLSVAAERMGSTSGPDMSASSDDDNDNTHGPDSGSSSSSSQASMLASGLDVRSETLGPRGYHDEGLTLPSASQIAESALVSLPYSSTEAPPAAAVVTVEELVAAAGSSSSSSSSLSSVDEIHHQVHQVPEEEEEAHANVLGTAVEISHAAAPSADPAAAAAAAVVVPQAEDPGASEDELQELAALQQENELLSELAGMHKQMTALTRQAAILEEKAKAVLQPADIASLSSVSMDESMDGGEEGVPDSATVTLVSSGAGVAAAAAGDTAGSSMERRGRWSSSVVTCPSLVEDTSPAGRLAALRARTAAAMAARFGVSRVLGGLPEAVGQLQVPDPVVAAAAVAATGLAAMQAVHHYGGHLLQNVNL